MRALWWAKLPEHAWQLTERMEAAGIAPDERFYARATMAAASVGLLDDADKLHREAQSRGLAVSEPARGGRGSEARSASSREARRRGDGGRR